MKECKTPAKVNLHLHIIGKSPDGYHNLQSLIAFTGLSDTITLTPSPKRKITLSGPFSYQISKLKQEDNLIEKSLRLLEQETKAPYNFDISLHKNIPTGGGLGGGSGNAAILLKSLNTDKNILTKITSQLGSDITAFLEAPAPVIMEETGNRINSASPIFPDLPILLVNNGEQCPTPSVYAAMEESDWKPAINFPDKFDTIEKLTTFLKIHTENSMSRAAIKTVPILQKTLNTIENQDQCLLSRLSGSGATCFGIFPTSAQAEHAATIIKKTHPEWWVMSDTLTGKKTL